MVSAKLRLCGAFHCHLGASSHSDADAGGGQSRRLSAPRRGASAPEAGLMMMQRPRKLRYRSKSRVKAAGVGRCAAALFPSRL